MIFNQIKYKWQNNNIEITENILSSMAGDRTHDLENMRKKEICFVATTLL